jgi:hypothetical protein
MIVRPADDVETVTKVSDMVRVCGCGREYRQPVPAALHAVDCPESDVGGDRTPDGQTSLASFDSSS